MRSSIHSDWGHHDRGLAERFGSWRRAADIFFKDLSLLASVYLARFIVWRELQRRRKADTTWQGPATDRREVPSDAVARLRGMEQERYLAEVANHRRPDK